MDLVDGKVCTLICLSIGTLKTSNFPYVPNGKLMILGVPISTLGRVSIMCLFSSRLQSEV